MTTKTDDIKLPPLPRADVTDPGRFGVAYYPATMAMYARTAVEMNWQAPSVEKKMPSDQEILWAMTGFYIPLKTYRNNLIAAGRNLLSRYGSGQHDMDIQHDTSEDGCTDPENCRRCQTLPEHRGDMQHAGIGSYPSNPAAQEPAIPTAIRDTIHRALVKFVDSELERYRELRSSEKISVSIYGAARIAAQRNMNDGAAAIKWLATITAAPVAQEPPQVTDAEIEQIVTGAGARWDGSVWKVEDADLHPMARALLYRYTTAPVAAQPVVTDEMVTRFLGWHLPQDFAPGAGISFKPSPDPLCWPIGTDLFRDPQARAMLEYVLTGVQK